MSTMIQIRHVPEQVHRKLKSRAAKEGLSLSDYLLKQIKQSAEQPTMAEITRRIARQPRVDLGSSIVDIIRAARGPLNGDDQKQR